MKVKVEKIYTDFRRMAFNAPCASWPTAANVSMTSGKVETFKIDARKHSRQCDLKSLMCDLLANVKAKSVICKDGDTVYCGAIKVVSLKGGKGY